MVFANTPIDRHFSLNEFNEHLVDIVGHNGYGTSTWLCRVDRWSYVVYTPEFFNPWGVKPLETHFHIIYVEGSASRHSSYDPLGVIIIELFY